MNEQVRRYLISRFAAGTALTLLRATVAWHVYKLTGSELLLGMIGLAQFIPAVVFLLGGGVLADRVERVQIVRRAQIVATLVSPFLALSTFTGHVNILGLYAAVAIIAGAGAMEQPARSALLVSLVPREEFPRVVTRAATVQALAFASGPALGGVLIAIGGPGLSYLAHIALMLVSVFAIATIRAVAPAPSSEPILKSIREGFTFVMGNRVVLACMALDMFAVILGGATALLPVFAEDILNAGPTGFGLLSASLEIGALGTAAYMAVRRPVTNAGQALLLAVVGYGCATIMFGLSTWLPLSLLAFALVGAFDQISVVMRHTAVQLSTPDHVRGRVSSINMLFIQASNQLGTLESGILASLTSAPFAVVFGGVGALVVAALFAIFFPELRRYRVTGAA